MLLHHLLDYFHHTPSQTMNNPDAWVYGPGFSVYKDGSSGKALFTVDKDKGVVLPTEAAKKPEDGAIFFDTKTKTLQVFLDGKPVIFKAASTATAPAPAPTPVPEPDAPISDKTPVKGSAKAAGKAAAKAVAKHKPKKLDVVAEPVYEEDDTSLQMDISEEEDEEDEEDGQL